MLASVKSDLKDLDSKLETVIEVKELEKVTDNIILVSCTYLLLN